MRTARAVSPLCPVMLLVNAVVVSAVGAGYLAAATPSWVPAGFGGAGAFLGVFFDRAHSGTVYAVSDVSGVLRSTDFGDHWETRSLGLPNHEISSLAVDPFDPDTLYAGAGSLAEAAHSGVYVTHNAGLSWNLLLGSHAKGMTFRRIRTLNAIAPDPAHQGVLVVGTRGSGVFRSTDSGVTWTQVLQAPSTSTPFFVPGMAEDDPTTDPHPAPVSTVLFDPASPATVYASFQGAGVSRSATGGVAGSWQTASAGLPAGAPVVDLAVSTGGVLWAAVASAGVYRSANGGASWTSANGNLPVSAEIPVSSVAAHPTDGRIAYATVVTYAYFSLWKTVDAGATWVEQGNVAWDEVHNPTRTWAQGPTLAWTVRVDPTNPSRVYYTDYWAILRSDDAGSSIHDRIVGAQNTCVANLFLDTDHAAGAPDTLYASLWDAGLLASTDKGATWHAVQPGDTWDPDLAGHSWDFAVASSAGAKVYLTTLQSGEPERLRIRRSFDAVNWSTVLVVEQPAAGFVGAFTLAVNPANRAVVYAALDGGSVYKSVNGGATWAPTSSQPGDNSFTFALDVDTSGRVFVGTLRDGLWRSSDGGTTWSKVLEEPGAVFNVTVAPGAVWATGNGGADLVRSTDGGDTWQAVAIPALADDGDGIGQHGMSVAVDPSDPNHVLLGTADTWHNADAGAGIAESRDGGATWRWANPGLGLLSVSALTVGRDGTVWAGTHCASVWRRDPGRAPCTVACSASVPAAAVSGQPVMLSGGATPSSCTCAAAYDWDFGDGATHSAKASPSHTYSRAGSYNWKLTASADGVSCTSSGSIAIASACTLGCSASVSASSGAAPLAVTFSSAATPANCTGTPVLDWDFGDGSSHSKESGPAHTYTTAGSFTWKLTVTAEGQSCVKTGTISVTEPPPAAVYVVPAVAHNPGTGGTQWRSDVAAVNRGASTASLTLTFYSDAAPIVRTASLAPGATTEWRDILVSLFGLPTGASSSGAVQIASSARLAITSRTYNQTLAGTFGQSYPALEATGALGAGLVGVVGQLKKSAAFRTNLGVVNLGSASCTAVVRLWGPAGGQLGSAKSLTVAAGRWLQQNDIFAATAAGAQDLAYATVEVQTPGCTLWAYGSVIDQATGDPTTVPVLVP
jgi:PKD repeat protein